MTREAIYRKYTEETGLAFKSTPHYHEWLEGKLMDYMEAEEIADEANEIIASLDKEEKGGCCCGE